MSPDDRIDDITERPCDVEAAQLASQSDWESRAEVAA